MKQIILLLALTLIFTTISIGQIKDGKYFENSDYISFKSDSVNFKIGSESGLSVDLYASGTFELFKNFLIIKAGYQGLKSTHIKTQNQGDKEKISVFDPEARPVIGVNVVLSDSSDNVLFGTVTNKEGIAMIEKMYSADKIILSYVGYDTYSFEYTDHFNYQVNFVDYGTIENQTVVFKVNTVNNDTLKLTLLTTDFRKSGDKERELNKLYKKSKKFPNRERILIKE